MGGGTGGTAVANTNCVKALFGRYLLRMDGKLLYEADSPPTQTPVLDAATGAPLSDVTSAQPGAGYGCAALGVAKTASCWRTAANGNSQGALGNGTIESSGPVFRATTVLTAVNQPLTGVASVASADAEEYQSSSSSACAVAAGGKLYCWGDLTWITSGGVTLSSAYAVPITTDGISPLTGVLQVAVMFDYACALIQGNSAKEVWCWGNNRSGELGLGDVAVHRYPTKVVGLENPSKVVVSGRFFYGTTCAIDGANVRCWGYNEYFGAGTGTTTNPVIAPTIVTLMSGSPLGDVVDIHAGNAYSTSCALTGSRTLQCWGNSFLQYAAAFGLSNVIALGGTDGGVSGIRYVTSDGVFHSGTATRAPNCGLLQ